MRVIELLVIRMGDTRVWGEVGGQGFKHTHTHSGRQAGRQVSKQAEKTYMQQGQIDTDGQAGGRRASRKQIRGQTINKFT